MVTTAEMSGERHKLEKGDFSWPSSNCSCQFSGLIHKYSLRLLEAHAIFISNDPNSKLLAVKQTVVASCQRFPAALTSIVQS